MKKYEFNKENFQFKLEIYKTESAIADFQNLINYQNLFDSYYENGKKLSTSCLRSLCMCEADGAEYAAYKKIIEERGEEVFNFG